MFTVQRVESTFKARVLCVMHCSFAITASPLVVANADEETALKMVVCICECAFMTLLYDYAIRRAYTPLVDLCSLLLTNSGSVTFIPHT